MARRKAAEERHRSVSRVAASLTSVKYIFNEEPAGWQQAMWGCMDEDDQAASRQAWQKAEFPPASGSTGNREEADALQEEERQDIDKRW